MYMIVSPNRQKKKNNTKAVVSKQVNNLKIEIMKSKWTAGTFDTDLQR